MMSPDNTIPFLVGALSSLLVYFLGPLIQRILIKARYMLYSLLSKAPDISGEWIAEYDEPNSQNDGRSNIQESIDLEQLGMEVSGRGISIDADGKRVFNFTGRIENDVFHGKFIPLSKRPDSSTGTGTFTLQLLSNRTMMTGTCSWLDSQTNEVDVSTYTWKKI